MKITPSLRPFLILSVALSILGGLSFVDMTMDNRFVQIKRTDLFAGLGLKKQNCEGPKTGPAPVAEDHRRVPSPAAPSAVAPGQTEASVPIIDYGSHDGGALRHFFAALHNSRNNGKKVRIAYFGDSLIEGDLITQDLRNSLQKQFGGRGVGFVPITSVTADFRRTIRHSFSGNWRSASILQSSDRNSRPGVSGFVFFPRTQSTPESTSDDLPNRRTDASWVKYEATKTGFSHPSFDSVDLFFENPHSEAVVSYTTGGGIKEKMFIEPGSTLSRITLEKCRLEKSVKLTFFPSDPLRIYGVAFEGDGGVYVDNFSLRGSSGTNLANLSCRMFSDFNRFREYKLAILHYGPNIANYTTTHFGWYKERMIRVVNHLKECLPETSILIVSVNDICSRGEDGLSTAASIPHLVDAQQSIARETGVAFWNLFSAMGGRDSMARWVKAKHPMASADCTHLNHAGAQVVGRLLSESLLSAYGDFATDQSARNSKKLTKN